MKEYNERNVLDVKLGVWVRNYCYSYKKMCVTLSDFQRTPAGLQNLLSICSVHQIFHFFVRNSGLSSKSGRTPDFVTRELVTRSFYSTGTHGVFHDPRGFSWPTGFSMTHGVFHDLRGFSMTHGIFPWPTGPMGTHGLFTRPTKFSTLVIPPPVVSTW